MNQDGFVKPPMTVRFARPGSVRGRARVPGSKSQTNRAFLLAALGAGDSRLTNAMIADDAARMVQGLRALGIAVEPLDAAGESWRVRGGGGWFPDVGPTTVDAGLAGTVMRFLSAVATLAPHETTITGQAPLLRRPIGELLTVLRGLGADIAGAEGGFPPVTVRPKRPRGGTATVDASKSSQFASALILAAPCFVEGVRLHVAGLGAAGYLEMTVEMLRRRGVNVERSGSEFSVPPGVVHALDEHVSADASAASHLMTLAAGTTGEVIVENLAGATLQPDLQILETLTALGCTVTRYPDASIGVAGPERLAPVDTDLSETPDQLPNMVVLAALAQGRSVIRGVGITRFHETDRMASLQRELAKVAVRLDVVGDDVVVHGGSARPGARLESHHDHRLGMAFATLGAALGDITIENAYAVDKTYPGFWSDIQQLGVPVSW